MERRIFRLAKYYIANELCVLTTIRPCRPGRGHFSSHIFSLLLPPPPHTSGVNVQRGTLKLVPHNVTHRGISITTLANDFCKGGEGEVCGSLYSDNLRLARCLLIMPFNLPLAVFSSRPLK